MVLAARFPDVERARRRINEADRKLREALEKGQTWHNTPWPNYRVIFDEKGMAVDVVEVEDGDEVEDEVDQAENELRKVWARFETQTFNSASVDKLRSGSIDLRTNPRPKRKCREEADDVPSDNHQRRNLETSSFVSSTSSNEISKNSTSKSCAQLRGLDHELPSGRRSGLRSSNSTRNR